MFRVFWGVFWVLSGVPGFFGCSGMFRDVPGCSGMFRDVPGCSGVPECFVMIWDVPVFRNVP